MAMCVYSATWGVASTHLFSLTAREGEGGAALEVCFPTKEGVGGSTTVRAAAVIPAAPGETEVSLTEQLLILL
jgi:hypothetical protein